MARFRNGLPGEETPMRTLVWCTIALAAAQVAAAAPGTVVALRATLTPRAQLPAPNGDVGAARGSFRATFDRASATLRWRLTSSELTGHAVAAFVHRGGPRHVTDPSGSDRVARLCGPCPSTASGVVRVPPRTFAALLARHQAYVDVQTDANVSGEIRGPIVVAK